MLNKIVIKMVDIRGFLSVFFLLFSGISLALPLESYPHAKLLFESRDVVDDYRLGLGSIEKVNNRWRLEREQRLSGELHRRTFELSEENAVDEVFSFYRQQLLKLSGRELFYCEARGCGSSSAWANTHFHIKQLYGLDSDQYYSAFEVIASDDSRTYVSLYAVLRGNKRVYLQIDALKTTESPRIYSSSETIVERLEQGESVSFVGAYQADGRLDGQFFAALVEVLDQYPTWIIGLVGHDFSPLPFEQQRSQSLAMSSTVKQQLIAAGVKPERVQVFGLGGLVPASRIGKSETNIQVVLIGR